MFLCNIHIKDLFSLKDVLYKFINDPIFDFVVTLCIILNTVFLAVEHHGMSVDLQYVLDMGNKVMLHRHFCIKKGMGGNLHDIAGDPLHLLKL